LHVEILNRDRSKALQQSNHHAVQDVMTRLTDLGMQPGHFPFAPAAAVLALNCVQIWDI